MMRIGSGELVLIFVLALFIFGPARLPELGRMVGKAVGSCKYYMDSFADECKGMEEDLKQVDREVRDNPIQTVRPAAKAKAEAAKAEAAQQEPAAPEETAAQQEPAAPEETAAQQQPQAEKNEEPAA